MLQLALELLHDRLVVCQLSPGASWPRPPADAGFYSLTRAEDEWSIVCAEVDAPSDARVERGWRIFKLRGPFDFGLTGILAAVLDPLAVAGVGIFALSTYNTDYVMVREFQLAAACAALEAAGHHVVADDAATLTP